MKKFISHKWYAGGVKEVDTNTGEVSSAPDKEWNETGFGSVWKQNGKYFIFYRDEESILLQQGRKKWRVIPEYTVILRGYFFVRNFKIFHQGKVVYSIWYKPSGVLFWLVDPTYDSIDAETDDFFLYVKNMWAYWGERPYSEFLEEFKEKNV